MKIGLQTWGTRGDVEPFYALARELMAAGHEVRVVVSTQSDAILPSLDGAEVTMVGGALNQAQGDELFDRVIALGSPMAQARLVLDEGLLPGADAMYEAAEDLCAQCDLVVRHHFLFMTQAAALKAGVPEVSVYLTPDLLPTRRHPPTGMPSFGPFQGAAWWLADKGISGIFGAAAARYRARAGVARHRGVLRDVWPSATANLIAVSGTLSPRPEDWPDHHHVTGFWTAPSSCEAALDPTLAEFLEAGEPPVYACFGSMGASRGGRRERDVALLTEAAQLAGRRLVLQLPEGEPSPRSDDVLVVSYAPHGVVFPRCAAVIHHGGAGTTQTTIAAGTPSVVVPHLADQFFWGAQVERLGAGVATRARSKVMPAELARAIGAACGVDTARIEALGLALRSEEGARVAAEKLTHGDVGRRPRAQAEAG